MRSRTSIVFGLVAVLLTAVIGLGLVRAGQPDESKSAGPRSAAGKTTGQGKRGAKDMGSALVSGLQQSPGCLGVETARTGRGQQVIFAWFENKKAVLTWYDSPMHQSLAGKFFQGRPENYQPLAQIKDDSGPIMVIAALRYTDKPQVDGVTLPISQISIELYQPLPAGLSINGAFTPEGVPVPGRRDQKLNLSGKNPSDAPAAQPTAGSR